MKNKDGVSRRKFLKTTSMGLGGSIVGASAVSCVPGRETEKKGNSREVCLASVDLKGLWPDRTRESRIGRMLERMEDVTGLKPDIVCLPELFDTSWVEEERPLAEIAEDEKEPGPVTRRIAEYAKRNACYVICPIYTTLGGRYYNSCVLIDRGGKIAGVYHKIHPVKTEIIDENKGGGVLITPGALEQPVMETDFGKIGMLICYDANWQDRWESLKKQGAEIIFFSSQFPGGRMLNYYALRNGSYLVSSTGGDARVIDISGNDLDSSSTFVRYAWARVNLEKANTPTWPTRDKLPELFRKYGDRIAVKVWDETDVITLESREAGLRIADVLKEFDIQTIDAVVEATEQVQLKYRI